jgi:hypothetical protein
MTGTVALPTPRQVTHAPRESRLAAVLTALLLAATFTSSNPVLGAFAVVISVAIAVLRTVAAGKIDRIAWAVILFLGWTVLLGVLVGAAPGRGSFGEFFGYEGRPFLAYAPLLALATIRTSVKDVTRVRYYMRVAVFAGGVVYVASKVGAPFVPRSGAYFHGLTSSHHSAGTLFGSCALVLLVASPKRARIDHVAGFVGLGLTVLSGSRTSLLGLAIAGIYLIATGDQLNRRIRGALALVCIGAAALLMSDRAANTLVSVSSEEFAAAAKVQFSSGRTADTGKFLEGPAAGAESVNVLKRIGVWRGGIDEFLRSPVVGIGSWRLNDLERSYGGVAGTIEVATQAQSVHSQGFGAHNAVIQMAAETGLIGVALWTRSWSVLLRRIGAVAAPDRDARAGRALAVFAFGTVLASNAILSPALCFPVFAYLATLARLPHPDNLDDPALRPRGGPRLAARSR